MTKREIAWPPGLVDALLAELPPGRADDMGRMWRKLLDDNKGAMRAGFMAALASPGVDVHRGQCEDDPGEIVVRATGRFADGSSCRDFNLLLMAPGWSKGWGEASEALADAVVRRWEDLRRFASEGGIR
jgi:hypothetical protein